MKLKYKKNVYTKWSLIYQNLVPKFACQTWFLQKSNESLLEYFDDEACMYQPDIPPLKTSNSSKYYMAC